jgi:predicted transcriptional regulator
VNKGFIMAGRDKTVSDAQILYYFAVSDKPVLNVSRLNDKIDITRQGIYSRLKELEEDGYLDSMNVGASAKVYWLTEKGEQYVQDHYFSSPSDGTNE